MRVTLLGTGTSTGIPVIGCSCDVCTSDDARDRRLRCSCHIACNGVHIVVDTGPDFRQQALNYGIPAVDAVLFTHHHFDHVVGIDDLRPFSFRSPAPIPCFARPNTLRVLQRMFSYIFDDSSYPGVSNLELVPVTGDFIVRSRQHPDREVSVSPIEVDHGELAMFGYRIGRFAYVTDTNNIPEASIERLRDLDVLVLDALRERRHPTHFNFDEAVAVAREIGARRTFFVHMTHSVRHAELDARLPDGMNLAFDGLTFEVGA